MSLCDKSKTEKVILPALKADQKGVADDDQSSETVEHQRTRCVLAELRSTCKTAKALQSFETFEKTLLTSRSRTPLSINETSTALNATAGTEDKSTASSSLRHPWLFGSTMHSTTAAGRVSSVSKNTAANTRIPSTMDKSGGLVKSKTTGTLAATGLRLQEGREKVIGATVLRVGKTQHTRQVSHLSVQAQMNAKALRERDERAVRRADETLRRVSSRSASSALISAQASKNNNQKARAQANLDAVEARRHRVRPSHPNSLIQRVDIPNPHPRLPSAVATLGGFERRVSGRDENHKTSVADLSPRTLNQHQAHPRQNSEQRELRRRENRQNSGEILKNMVTGGLKGVRRIGRSLAGRSELEELSHIHPPGARGPVVVRDKRKS